MEMIQTLRAEVLGALAVLQADVTGEPPASMPQLSPWHLRCLACPSHPTVPPTPLLNTLPRPPLLPQRCARVCSRWWRHCGTTAPSSQSTHGKRCTSCRPCRTWCPPSCGHSATARVPSGWGVRWRWQRRGRWRWGREESPSQVEVGLWLARVEADAHGGACLVPRGLRGLRGDARAPLHLRLLASPQGQPWVQWRLRTTCHPHTTCRPHTTSHPHIASRPHTTCCPNTTSRRRTCRPPSAIRRR